jgi:hypothetical protein
MKKEILQLLNILLSDPVLRQMRAYEIQMLFNLLEAETYPQIKTDVKTN